MDFQIIVLGYSALLAYAGLRMITPTRSPSPSPNSLVALPPRPLLNLLRENLPMTMGSPTRRLHMPLYLGVCDSDLKNVCNSTALSLAEAWRVVVFVMLGSALMIGLGFSALRVHVKVRISG